jgi:hypothetical protein
MDAVTGGYYDVLNKKANDNHVPDIDKAADFWDPVKTKELVVSKFKADIKPAKTKYYQDGVMMNDNYQIPAYYKIVEDKKEPVLDTNTVKTKDGDTYELATDNMKDILTGTMQEKMAIAHHARELKETSKGQEAFIALEGNKDPEAFNRYVIADFAKVLPKGYKENTEVDPGFAFKNRGTGDKKEKTKDSLEYTQSLFGQSFSDADKFPVADKRFYSQSSLPKGSTLQNFHDITSTSGDDLLKDASNISFKIWRNTEDGKDYFTIEETRGTNSVQTALSKEAERKGWQKGQFYEVPNAAFYLNFPAHKYSTDTRSLTKGAGSTTTNNPAVSVQAAATTAPATTSSGGINWSERVKKRKEEQQKGGSKKKINNPTSQVANPNSNDNEDDEWINTILDFEDTKGSRMGTPMMYKNEKNFGYNKYSDELIKIKDIKERKKRAIELFKKEVLPQVKHLPLEIRKRAADLIYNGGQDPRTFLVYAAKGLDSIPKDIAERQKYWGGTKDKKEIDKLWSQNKDLVEKQLNDPDFIDRLDEIRGDYYNRLSDKEAYNNSWVHRLKIFNKNK